jgi:hypothetical protein
MALDALAHGREPEAAPISGALVERLESAVIVADLELQFVPASA